MMHEHRPQCGLCSTESLSRFDSALTLLTAVIECPPLHQPLQVWCLSPALQAWVAALGVPAEYTANILADKLRRTHSTGKQ